jgi:hypothetical protein
MILSKLILVENIVNEISDNSTGQISPHDIRHNLLDIIDSVHLLTIGKPLSGSNFGTPPSRTTRVGELSIDKLGLEGYFSVDNSAFGYAALRSNYQGVRNTALGSHSLSCNIYGEDNIGVGYSSLGGNTVGFANLGFGNYALANNKEGNFNIAIGHAAGYYVDKNTSNKLFIASHPVDSEYICDNPLGSGLIPLVYGDLDDLRFGIKTRSLHDYGVLQVSGDISPVNNAEFNLGHRLYAWKTLFLTDSIAFSNDTKISASGSDIAVSGNLLPLIDQLYDLGSTSNIWNKAYLNDIFVSGIATINRLKAIEQCDYLCKTINLAGSGSIDTIDGGGPESLYEYAYQDHTPAYDTCGMLSDEELTGAGFLINSSGVGYVRQYKFDFMPPNESISCLNSSSPYAKASWNSNISLHLSTGNHLLTDRVLFPKDISLVSQYGCHGAFLLDDKFYFAHEADINVYPRLASSSGYIAGISDVNFVAASGRSDDYIVNIVALESGISVSQRFLTAAKIRTKDALNDNKDKLQGFEIQYIDDSNNVFGNQLTDRLVIGSYNKTSKFVNAATLLKGDNDGVFGINNLSPLAKNVLPETSLNLRMAGNAIARLTAENQSNTVSAVQLLGGSNCLLDGFEAQYYNGSGLADLSIYKDSGKSVFLRFYGNTNRLGLFTASGNANAMLTIGDSYNTQATISLYEASGSITSTSRYNKLFTKPKIEPYQGGTIYLLDGSGNAHDLVINKYSVTDGRGLYTDNNGNTFGGLYCPQTRTSLSSASGNTAIGYKAVNGITTGDTNVAFGLNCGSGISTGNANTLYGSSSATSVRTGSNNIVVGNNSFNLTSSNISNNIVIGNNGIANGTSGDYQFYLGASNSLVLLHGILGPSTANKQLTMPSGGKLYINDDTNTDSLCFKTNTIQVIDGGGNNYPDNTLVFNFTGNNSADLFKLNHSADPLNVSPTYFTPNPIRPYAELKGDIKLLGAIRFSDATSLDSANFLTDIDVLESGLQIANSGIDTLASGLASFTIEGYAVSAIGAPASSQNPNSGLLQIKDRDWNTIGTQFVVNRDVTSVIHSGAYVVAMRVNNEYRPIWISASDTSCECCHQ